MAEPLNLDDALKRVGPKKGRGRPFKPGNEFAFKPGEGRKEGSKGDATLISEATKRGLEAMVASGEMTMAKALALRRFDIALRGKPGIALQAIQSIEDRIEGRPTQSIQVTQSIDDEAVKRLLELAERWTVKSQPVIEATQQSALPREQWLHTKEPPHTAENERMEHVRKHASEVAALPPKNLPISEPSSNDAEIAARLGSAPIKSSCFSTEGKATYFDLSTGERSK